MGQNESYAPKPKWKMDFGLLSDVGTPWYDSTYSNKNTELNVLATSDCHVTHGWQFLITVCITNASAKEWRKRIALRRYFAYVVSFLRVEI